MFFLSSAKKYLVLLNLLLFSSQTLQKAWETRKGQRVPEQEVKEERVRSQRSTKTAVISHELCSSASARMILRKLDMGHLCRMCTPMLRWNMIFRTCSRHLLPYVPQLLVQQPTSIQCSFPCWMWTTTNGSKLKFYNLLTVLEKGFTTHSSTTLAMLTRCPSDNQRGTNVPQFIDAARH